jgi:hypothetical protein
VTGDVVLTRATQWLLIGIILQATATAQDISPADASSGSPTSPVTQSDETADKTPKPELERPTAWGEPTEVEVSILVLDVDEVNSAEQSFPRASITKLAGAVLFWFTTVRGRCIWD